MLDENSNQTKITGNGIHTSVLKEITLKITSERRKGKMGEMAGEKGEAFACDVRVRICMRE